jgi:hypothetical protein
VRFERTELGQAAEPVDPKSLVSGQSYYFVQYSDPNLRNPIVQTYIFLGSNLREGDDDVFYFQSPDSYAQGLKLNASVNNYDGRFYICSGSQMKFIFDFEYCVDELLKCSIRRESAKNKR